MSVSDPSVSTALPHDAENAAASENYLTQPMFVAESFIGRKGQFVKVGETLDDVERIIDGKMDNRSEAEFYMIGTID